MDQSRKKELRDAYKNRQVIGGVCCIRCSETGRLLLQATRDIEGLKNRFKFSQSIKSCPDPAFHGEWLKYGQTAFNFEVLEELKKGENQTDKEFSDDIALLYEMWNEKYQQGMLK